ncbi:MAG: DMT family transporter [Sphingobium sp.]|nr:DMT family transporter [Sphingobium sp.]
MHAAHPIRAALLFNFGLMLFACLDTINKHLTASVDVPVIVAARYIGNLVLMLAIVGPVRGRELVRAERKGLVWIRGACLAASSLFIVLSLKRIPVAETTAISFLAPIVVVVAAGPLLGEKVGARGWVAVFMGFTGVLLIARPGSGLEPVGVLCALCSVIAATTYQLLSRYLASTETTLAMLFYSALAGSIAFGGVLPWFWPDHAPTLREGIALCCIGGLGGLGHFLFTAAFRNAPASLLAPMSYLQLIWALLFGWIGFGHIPDAVGMLGIAIVGASGVLAALRSRQVPEEPAA